MMKFPRTMTRGVFKGRHFETASEYVRAINEHRDKYGVSRKSPRTKKAVSVVKKTKTNGTVSIRRHIDLYEMLRAEGIGKEKIVQMIALMESR